MILITNTFSKLLMKIKSVGIKEVQKEINKYESGLNNLIELTEINGNKILKGYLLSKKVRLLVYYKQVGKLFVPFYIVKKETKYGYNIRSELNEIYLNQLDKSIEDIDLKKFKII